MKDAGQHESVSKRMDACYMMLGMTRYVSTGVMLFLVAGCLIADLHDQAHVEEAIAGPIGSKLTMRFIRTTGLEELGANGTTISNVCLTRGCWLPNLEGCVP